MKVETVVLRSLQQPETLFRVPYSGVMRAGVFAGPTMLLSYLTPFPQLGIPAAIVVFLLVVGLSALQRAKEPHFETLSSVPAPFFKGRHRARVLVR